MLNSGSRVSRSLEQIENRFCPREAIRGSVLHFLDDPVAGGPSYEFHADGLLIVEDGYISKVGSAPELLPQLDPQITLTDCTGKLIVSGFIDAHVHFVQARGRRITAVPLRGVAARHRL